MEKGSPKSLQFLYDMQEAGKETPEIFEIDIIQRFLLLKYK
jgi:hypothetical protein